MVIEVEKGSGLVHIKGVDEKDWVGKTKNRNEEGPMRAVYKGILENLVTEIKISIIGLAKETRGTNEERRNAKRVVLIGLFMAVCMSAGPSNEENQKSLAKLAFEKHSGDAMGKKYDDDEKFSSLGRPQLLFIHHIANEIPQVILDENREIIDSFLEDTGLVGLLRTSGCCHV